MSADVLALMAAPFAVTVLFVAIHTHLGLHVLRRRVVFADLALAQLSALGATLAVVSGHAPGEVATFVYSILFALAGAAVLTGARAASRAIGQEALVGIIYVSASAATVLVVDRAPQGAEHVKRMLVGTLLDVGPAQLAKIAALYSGIALLHWIVRRKLLEASEGRLAGASATVWDFLFYASFGAVVTSSVAVGGVLVVFSLLIIPAVAGMLFAPARIGVALLVGWGVGLAGSVGGFATSLAFDVPTGAALVLALAVALGVAGAVRFLWFGEDQARRRARLRTEVARAGLLLVLAASLWSLAKPGADQPLLAALDRLGLRPELFMPALEAEAYGEARATEGRYLAELEALAEGERRARWQGARLTDDEVRRVASYQQTYNEMGRGERFVQQYLVARARARERWLVSLPTAVLSAVGLLVLFRSRVEAEAWLRPRNVHSASTRTGPGSRFGQQANDVAAAQQGNSGNTDGNEPDLPPACRPRHRERCRTSAR